MELRVRLREFAPSPERDDRGPDEEEILRQYAAQWYNGDEDPRVEKLLTTMGWEIGQNEDEAGGAFMVRHGDINGNSFISWSDDELSTLNEIAKIPQSELGDWGESGTLEPPKGKVNKKELPGGSGYTYAVKKNTADDSLMIMIFDGEKLAAELDVFETGDILNTWSVESIVVERPYRGQGLGKALYGIALSVLKLTLEAGQTQTRHGQAMWLMLNSIPGVEVQGYTMVPTDKYQAHKDDRIVKQDEQWTRYIFPVQPGQRSMRSGRPGAGLYTSAATMIARWTGK